MADLFGFSIRKNKAVVSGQSPVSPASEDINTVVASGGYYGQYIDMEGNIRNEYDLIRKYRDMALHPEVDSAIDEIVNEAIVWDMDDSPVEIELSNLNVSDGIKEKIREEFKTIKKLLSFDKKAQDIFRRWYIDGRLYYHKVIDLKTPKNGLTEIRYIDPFKIKKIREVRPKDANAATKSVKDSALAYSYNDYIEYFLYNASGFAGSYPGYSPGTTNTGIKIASDAITFVPSGILDLNKKTTLSYLNKAIKALNQIRMIEDSLVIYRISRAPERRIFYIDVGNLPKVKAEQYLREVMARYRNKLVYDASTGEIRDDKKHMSMLEDFWLPRREGGRGTEISTLPGGQNLGELKDVEYFRSKLYKSLNLPSSRLGEDNKSFSLGRSSEILRDELKFTKFVNRLRKQFSYLFTDLLKTQLILKGVITVEDWDEMEEHIQFDFNFDNHFSELKNAELMTSRLNVAQMLDPYLGKYYSVNWVRKQILMQSDEEIKEIDKEMAKDISTGIVPDPKLLNKLQADSLVPPTTNGSSTTGTTPKPPKGDADTVK
jgi:hypothetical protein